MGRPMESRDTRARKSSRPDQWRAMRFYYKNGAAWTLRDLQTVTGCSADAAKCFVRDLKKAGLVTCAGAQGRQKAWRLAGDPGPACPVVSRGRTPDTGGPAKKASKGRRAA